MRSATMTNDIDDPYGLHPAPLVSAGAAVNAIAAADPRFELVAGTLFFRDGDRRLTVEVRAWDITDAPFYARDEFEERAAAFKVKHPPFGRVLIERPEVRDDTDGWEQEVAQPRQPRRSVLQRILGHG
jgi:hypothetical protein